MGSEMCIRDRYDGVKITLISEAFLSSLVPGNSRSGDNFDGKSSGRSGGRASGTSGRFGGSPLVGMTESK